MFGSLALRNIKIRQIEINKAKTAPKPVFRPKTFIIKSAAPSRLSGMAKPDNEVFSGFANFSVLAIAFMTNKTSKMADATRA